MVNSIVIITDQSPIGKNLAPEAIRLASGLVALDEVKCKMIFLDDAIYLLVKNTDPESVKMESFSRTLELAEFSDIEMMVSKNSLERAGFTTEDLIENENLKVASSREIAKAIYTADATFRY